MKKFIEEKLEGLLEVCDEKKDIKEIKHELFQFFLLYANEIKFEVLEKMPQIRDMSEDNPQYDLGFNACLLQMTQEIDKIFN